MEKSSKKNYQDILRTPFVLLFYIVGSIIVGNSLWILVMSKNGQPLTIILGFGLLFVGFVFATFRR
ncbi:hypothetical protein A3A66_01700 [Microgenomates group bacterium RIFCSPLOWO2_01_FULL_46_13]|nr:MAG: hypothetical protein A2783_00705 [Microgenomates group bacterium RIFCSPHIGHO2_01_FULL_45_11]OGV94704.1 MAG: hypothetical protein A3A66_01700 [Microgenomates group bacterium RIFCSPLOWO2_01_FULL_46_13]